MSELSRFVSMLYYTDWRSDFLDAFCPISDETSCEPIRISPDGVRVCVRVCALDPDRKTSYYSS